MKNILLVVVVISFLVFSIGIVKLSKDKSNGNGDNRLVDVCLNYIDDGNYQKAIEVGRKIIALDSFSVDGYFCLGIAYTETGQVNSAIESLKKVENLTRDENVLVYVYALLSKNYPLKGDLDNAFVYGNRALGLAEKLGEDDLKASILNNIGLVLMYKKEFDKALSYFEESLKLQTNEIEKAFIYNNIALIYFSKKNYDKSIEYYKKSIKMLEKNKAYAQSGSFMLNLGLLYMELKDYVNARYYLDEGLIKVKESGNKYYEASGYSYLGLYYKNIRNIELSRSYFEKAYQIYESIGAKNDAELILKELKYLK